MRALPSQPARVKDVKSFLIDPFQQMIVEIQFPAGSLQHLCWLLDCEAVQAVPLNRSGRRNSLEASYGLLWVDESGLLREPFVYPQFKFARYAMGECPLTGYGVVTGGADSDGYPTDSTLDGETLCDEIKFERWQKRIDPGLVLEQVFRAYPKF
jgi:hypothetical protein